MDYQIWIKEEFGDTWSRVDAGDLGAAKREILVASKAGKEAILTVEVPFSLELKVGEPGGETKKRRTTKEQPAEESQEEGAENEADKDPAEQDQNPGE